MSLDRKQKILEVLLDSLAPGAIAVSGGLDSRLLAHIAWSRNLTFHPLHFAGPHLAKFESSAALKWLDSRGRPGHVLTVNVLSHPEVARNSRKRCYHCKKLMYLNALEFIRSRKLMCVMDGSHATDQRGNRPGLVALTEIGVRSPLAEALLTKDDIRELAVKLRLDNPTQPSRPCLLTRLEYDMNVDSNTLFAIARAEEKLMSLGLRDFRIRYHKDKSVVLQLAKSESGVWEKIINEAGNVLRNYRLFPYKPLFSDTVSGYFDEYEP